MSDPVISATTSSRMPALARAICGLGGVLRRHAGPAGHQKPWAFGETVVLYGKTKPAFLVLKPGNGEAPRAMV
jgi:hypothetical protein